MRDPSAGADGKWGTADDDPGDLHLTATSAAVNGGDNALAVDDKGQPLAKDQEGRPRVFDDLVDIGAYEFQGAMAPGRETASVVVTTDDDEFDLYDGEITLREAIYYSQLGAGSTITFDRALDNATITLDGWELLIYDSTTIDASALTSLRLTPMAGTGCFKLQDPRRSQSR